MPQYGAKNTPENLPPWAAAAAANIGEHPHALTARIDGSHGLLSDSKMRSLANRWAIEFKYLPVVSELWCPRSSTTPPLELTLTVADVPYLGPGDPTPEYLALANGTFTLTRRIGGIIQGGGCLWGVTQSMNETTLEHGVFFVEDPVTQGTGVFVYVYLSAWWPGFQQNIVSHFPHLDGPQPLLPDGRFDSVAAFPLTTFPHPTWDANFPVWDFEQATITCDILKPGVPPVVDAGDLTNTNRFWIDFALPVEKTGPLKAITGPDEDGFSVTLELIRAAVLPISQDEGWLWVAEVEKSGAKVALVVTEQPNGSAPMQFNETLEIPTKAGTVRSNDESMLQDGGYFVGVAARPYPENFQHWNLLERSPSEFEEQQTGLVSIAVHLSGWRFDSGLGQLGAFTPVQRLFAAYLNQTHILQPVHSIAGWVPNTLVKICRSFWDFDNEVFIEDLPGLANIEGMVYDAAIVLQLRATGLEVRVHFRASGVRNSAMWEAVPNVERSINWHLHEDGLGACFLADGSNGGGWDVLPTPFRSRDLDSHGFFRDSFVSESLFGPQYFPILPGTAALESISQFAYGQEPPLQGPLEMTIASKKSILITSDGVARSIGTTTPRVFGVPISMVGEWFDAQNPSDLVIPAGVTAIRGMAMATHSDSNLSANFTWENVTNPWPVSCQLGDNSGRTSQSRAMPVPLVNLPVSPGDIIHFTGRCTGTTWGDNPQANWCYLESVDRPNWSEHVNIAALQDSLPAVNDRGIVWQVPDFLDGLILKSCVSTFGDSKSSLGDFVLTLSVIREVSRFENGLLLSPLRIDNDHWSSRSSMIPAVIDPAHAQVFKGDLILWQVSQTQTDARGLSLTLDFEE